MKRHLIIITLSSILIPLIFNSCKKEEVYSLYSGTTKVNYGYSDLLSTLKFSNIHNESINWNISAQDDYFIFSKENGSLGSQEVQEIEITLDRSSIVSDSLSSKIYVRSNKGDQLVFEVSIKNFPEKKIRFDFNIYESAYNPVTDEVYFLNQSYSDFDMAVYNLRDGTLAKYDFDESNNYSYSNISISPNGNKAVLYRNYNQAIIIDLMQMEIIESLYIDDYIQSAVYTSSDIVYFVTNDYDNDLYVYNLNTNDLSIHDIGLGYYDDYEAVLHPDERFLYLIEDDYYYDSHIVKLNISSGVPINAANDHISNVSGPMWFNLNGDQILFSSKRYSAINPENAGIGFVNLLELENQASVISNFCENRTNGKYYIDFTYSSSSFKQNEVSVYSHEMQYLESIEAEDYVSVSSYADDYQFTEARILDCFHSAQYGLILVVNNSEGYSSDVAIEIIP